jgi:hydroxypyruvate reductase
MLRELAPSFARLPLVATLARDDRALRARILVSPEHLARAVARTLDAKVLRPSQASAEELAAEYAARAKRMRPGETLVRAAEPSVIVRHRAGKGGRSTHLAALVARELPPHVTFAAIATDGVDGASGTAGAIVQAMSSAELDHAIARFDTGSFLKNAGAALPSKRTGHNLADLHVLVRTQGGQG